MLSLSNSAKASKIAIIGADKAKCIYLKADDSDEPEIETTDKNKLVMFGKFLELDNKLTHSDIVTLKDAYTRGEDASSGLIDKKLSRKYEQACIYVNNSLKKHLAYGTSHELMPIVTEPSYRLFVSGLSGSGKSYFIAAFLKLNKPRTEGCGIFLFSPVREDKAFKSIKNLIHLDLDELQKEMKGKELEVGDIPDGSVIIFDDIESYPKHTAKRYMALRDMFLERGRGHREGEKGISTICVSHNAMNGHSTKASIRESQYWCVFPSANKRDVRTLLKTYGGVEAKDIAELMSQKTRWLFFKKSIPQYAVCEHSVIVI